MRDFKISVFLFISILLEQYLYVDGALTERGNTSPGESSTGKSEDNAVILIKDDSHFVEELEKHPGKLIIVAFTASWNERCEHVLSFFDQLPATYPAVVFMKVDFDKNQKTARAHNVGSVPTFVLFRDKKVLDFFRDDDDRKELETRIQALINYVPGNEEDVGVPGFINLSSFVDVCRSECLNDDIENNAFKPFLVYPGRILESDIDSQLIMSYSFTQPVRLHSLKIRAPTNNGPRRIKLFSNRITMVNFEDAEGDNEGGYELILTQEHMEGKLIHLESADFERVENLQIFVDDNHAGDDITRIDNLTLIGLPIDENDASTLIGIEKALVQSAKDLMSARGHVDLRSFIDRDRSSCLNDDSDNPFEIFLQFSCPRLYKYLVSDVGPHLLMSFAFTHRVQVYSLVVKAPATNGPRRIKLFTNLDMAKTGFEDVEKLKANQELMLTREDLRGKLIDLNVVDFQNVETLQIFVDENQNSGEITRIDDITAIGLPGEKIDTSPTTFEIEGKGSCTHL